MIMKKTETNLKGDFIKIICGFGNRLLFGKLVRKMCWELEPTCQSQAFFVFRFFYELLPMVESRKQDHLVTDVQLFFSCDGNEFLIQSLWTNFR